MTDLINRVDEWIKTDVNKVQELINKYASILQEILPEKNIPYLAVVIHTCVLFLNENHSRISADWKAWSVLLIKKLFEENRLKKEGEIHATINEFLEFKEREYKNYCDDIISVNDYERDRGFLYKFYHKKIGS
jgi:hypothetical protein